MRDWQATLSVGAARLDSMLWSFLSLLGFSLQNFVLAEKRKTNEHQKEDTEMYVLLPLSSFVGDLALNKDGG